MTRIRGDISLHDEDVPIIGTIARRLDGTPLAIEFAAARDATVGVQQVAKCRDDRLGFLTTGR